jgi:sialic acid synthase SpsE
MNEFEISGRKIGPQYKPLVIAEIGINHEGSLETAFEIVDAAAAGGAEIIKHQTHVVEDEMSKEAKKVIPGNADVSIYEIMERCALDEEQEMQLKEYVESKGMIFISTPFSRAAANRLQGMNVPAFKIGSGECNNYPLVKHIASFGKPMIMSTGMNSIESIRKSVAILEEAGIPYALLHTTNIYPTPPHLVRLGAMTELMEVFPNAVVGLSDHTTTNHACFGAVALGSCILERHFIDRMDRPGPDISCSMDGQALRELIEGANILQQERGGVKGPVKEEQPTIDFAYATVVTINSIKKGEVFTKENIWVKRPGTGELKADMFEKVLGCTAARDLDKDVHLKSVDITKFSL